MEETSKVLKHITVYNTLFHQIKNGKYSVGFPLPSEPKLAADLGVSRMTLRRALALLQEDGLIQNKQGKGNFVIDTQNSHKIIESPTLFHPVHENIAEEVTCSKIDFRIEPPSEFVLGILGHKTSAVVILDRWYAFEGKEQAYSLSFLPIEVISQWHIDLNSKKILCDFVECELYEIGRKSDLQYSFGKAGNFTVNRENIDDNEPYILVSEHIYDENTIMCTSKHYIPLSHFHLHITSSQEKK